MIQLKDVYRMLDGWAPYSTCLDFDNAGIAVGNMSDEVSRIAVALDLTDETLAAAAENGCDTVVTHHPAIFKPLSVLDSHSAVCRAAAKGIAVISAHTNLDAADGGVNDALAYALGLNGAEPLAGTGQPPMARICTVSPINDVALAEQCRRRLGVGAVKYVPTDRIIGRVAVCGGAGGDFIEAVAACGADAYITGECRHHERLEAARLGIGLFECGHFCTEQVVKAVVADRLRDAFADIEVLVLDEHDVARYI